IVARPCRAPELPTHATLPGPWERRPAVFHMCDCLVRCVLASDVAAAAFDTQILVDDRFYRIVEIEKLPICCVRHGSGAEFCRCAIALLIHPGLKSGDHFLNDL